MEMEAIVTSVNHTLEYMPYEADPIFSPYSFQIEIEENDIFGTEYVVMDESSSCFKTSGEGALTTYKKSNIFCEIDKGIVRLFDSRVAAF